MIGTTFGASSAMVPAISAREFKAGDIVVGRAFSRPNPAGAKVGVGDAAIPNLGTGADGPVGGSSGVSERFEPHRSKVVDGVARMRPVAGSVAIGPDETVDLGSEAAHSVQVDFRKPLPADETFAAQLVDEKAGVVPVEFEVAAFGRAMRMQETQGQ